MKNTLNDHVATLGNVCVNRFIGIPSALVFDGLRRIMSDPTAVPNDWQYSAVTPGSLNGAAASLITAPSLAITHKETDNGED